MFVCGMTRKVLCLSVALALLGALPARAALFDDDEARRQIKDLSLRSEERIDTLSKGLIDLLNQIQALREEILAQVTPENHSLGHYFSHLNNGGNSSSASETRFRTQALRHVQAGFDPSIGGADAPSGMSYFDLGLG